MRSRKIGLATGLNYHLLEWNGDQPKPQQFDHTVILLHGFLDLSWSWAEVAPVLAEHFHVIAPDMRGHGDSDRVGSGGYYHFVDYLADLHEVIAQTARARLSLVGHSMGGAIAAYYTGSFPQKINKLALLEGVGVPESLPGPEKIVTWLDSWNAARERKNKEYESLGEAAVRLCERDPLCPKPTALELAKHATTILPNGKLAFKHDPVHLSTGPFGFEVEVAARFWQRITCPTLLIEGAVSPFRFAKDEMARRYAHFHHRQEWVIEHAGHMMMRHQPKKLAEGLVQFLLDPDDPAAEKARRVAAA